MHKHISKTGLINLFSCLNNFTFLMSWSFISNYTVWALLIVKGCIIVYSCQHPLHFNYSGYLSHWQSYHISTFLNKVNSTKRKIRKKSG